jgi:hypothetical protein
MKTKKKGNRENLLFAPSTGYTTLKPEKSLVDKATFLKRVAEGKIPLTPFATTTVTKKTDAIYAYDEKTLQATLKAVLSPKAKRTLAAGKLGVATASLDVRTALLALVGVNKSMFSITLESIADDFENKREQSTAKLVLPYLTLKVTENGKDLLKTIKDLGQNGPEDLPEGLYNDLKALRDVFFYETYREDGTAFMTSGKTLTKKTFAELLRRIEPHLDITVDLEEAIAILMNEKRRPDPDKQILELTEAVKEGHPRIILTMADRREDAIRRMEVPFRNLTKGAVKFTGEAAVTLLWDLLLCIRDIKVGITVSLHQLSRELAYTKLLQEHHQTLFSYDGTK